MLVLAMAFTALWGVLQLAVLGYATRSVRLGLLALAVGLGFYGCGLLAVGIEFVLTRVYATATGEPLRAVVETASYTTDPFVEEIVKIAPLLILAWSVRHRAQRGLTDFLVLGGAFGAGFGLLEATMRFGSRAAGAIGVPQGWVLPTGLSPPIVPDPLHTLTLWLPAPVGGDYLSLNQSPGLSVHLVWSAVAGLGIGLLLRGPGRFRLLGPLLVLLVSLDHALVNYALTHPGSSLTSLAGYSQDLRWIWPLLALAAAVALDHQVLSRMRQAHPAPLAAEQAGAQGLIRFAGLGLPWTPLLFTRYLSLRRATWYSFESRRGDGEQLLAELETVRQQMDAADTADSWRPWRGFSRISRDRRAALTRFWPLLLWAVLLLPAAIYYGLGSTPWAAGVQRSVSEHRPLFVLMLLLPGLLGLALLGWQLFTAVRSLPTVRTSSWADPATGLYLRIGTALGAFALGSLSLVHWVGGGAPDQPVIQNVHVLDALSSMLLIGGIALTLGAFVFFPPSIGLAAVVTSAGATVLVPTATMSGAFVTTATLGLAGVMLSQAAGPGQPGSGNSGGVPDLPQKPPAPIPRVRHWRLQNIVKELYKGTTRSNRVGDGTTMDAIRNELRTGRPTGGTFHREKGEVSLNGINRWLRTYERQASSEDVKWARWLKTELQRALKGQ
ncbi:PrsW family glutamic-type intramembrane protease [Kineosporia babensis]|uniref:PrsW family glutamic-type intramembrane protease n=1 Tax=Kineosporia babensis TaxID=499548 RepID=A0A9X1SXU2_9ACTN|nr:PrsW family glutamic-type intramembrane protease [Kineosporia babensis]MCD5310468.1 PrsW family glutamic-type intramembrane protease [Kineosporia babensis]